MLQITESEKELIFKLAERLTGCNTDTKRDIFIQNVLRRIEARQAKSVRAYLQLALSDEAELPHLVSALTIHTTSWFREQPHYDWMSDFMATRPDKGEHATIRLLSAGCSTALELYSFGLMFEELRRTHRLLDYKLEGWDIDPITLGKARTGTFPKSDLASIPVEFHRYFKPDAISSGSDKPLIVIDQAIRDRTTFRAVNILNPPVSSRETFDFVICRNVLIYFRMEQVREIINQLMLQLNKDGHLILGLSEAVEPAAFNIIRVGPTIYQPDPAKASVQNTLGAIKSQHGLDNVQRVSRRPLEAVPRILVVDDDPDFLTIIQDILQGYNLVMDTAFSAKDALDLIKNESYDLILCDQRMPGMTGLEFLQRIRVTDHSTGFIMISGYSDPELTKDALNFGASDVLAKPFDRAALLTMIERHVTLAPKIPKSSAVLHTSCDAILIGASTGGPEALNAVLPQMPQGTPPLVIVQHISANFVTSLGRQLSTTSGLRLCLVKDTMPLRNDTIYMTLEDRHLILSEHRKVLHVGLSNRPSRHGHRPSIDELFESGAPFGHRLAAMLLTGMGRDGADGLLKLRRAGCITMAQDEKSSIVFGMPGAAAALGAPIIVGDPRLLRSALDDAIRGRIKRDMNRIARTERLSVS